MDSSRWRSADPSGHRRHHRSHRRRDPSDRHHHRSRYQKYCNERDGGEIPKSLNYCEIGQQQKHWKLGSHGSSKKGCFPEEIIGEILVRLPSVKSVIKCSAVCKSWRCLIKSSTFIDAHLSRNKNKNDDDDVVSPLLLLSEGMRRVFLLYRDTPAASAFGGTNAKVITPFTYTIPFAFKHPDKVFTSSSGCFNLVGTCNGLLCLALDYDPLPIPTIIWNPSVRKYVTLPSPNITFSDDIIGDDRPIPTSAFGYDSQTNDYKVLKIFSKTRNRNTLFGAELYSLARGSWKTLSPPTDAFPHCCRLAKKTTNEQHRRKHVFVSDALHRLVNLERRGECLITLIVSFDMVTESFGQIKTPEALTNPSFLSVHEESLALIEVEREFVDHPDPTLGTSPSYHHHLHLWVMQQYGGVESWTKLSSVTLQNQESYPFHFAFKSSGEQVFEMCDHIWTDMLVVDFKTKQVKYSGVQHGCQYESIDSFVESLVLLDHSNAISY